MGSQPNQHHNKQLVLVGQAVDEGQDPVCLLRVTEFFLLQLDVIQLEHA